MTQDAMFLACNLADDLRNHAEKVDIDEQIQVLQMIIRDLKAEKQVYLKENQV